MRRALTRTTLRLGTLADRVARRRLMLQTAAGTIAFLLGFWGWTLKSPPEDWNGWANDFFRTVQLITLHFPTEFDGALPWQLQVGRLAVPLVAFFASLNVVLGALTRPVRLALLPFVRNHVVFFGAPKLTDAATAKLIAEGHHLVFVHPGIDGARLDVLEGIGITVVATDPLQTPILADLNLASARAVFVSTGNDVDNANLAMMIADHAGRRDDLAERLVLAVEFEREDLAAELVAVVDDTAKGTGIRFYRLAPDREGLSLELRVHAPAFAPGRGAVSAHALVVGLVGSWEQALSRLLVALQDRPDDVPIVSLILDPAERDRFEAWRRARSDLALVARFEVLPRGAGLLHDPQAAPWRADIPAPQIVVVMREDAEGLATALALRHSDCGIPAATPILVRQSREDHILDQLSKRVSKDDATAPLVPFGGLLRDAGVSNLLDRVGDRAAIALHARYLEGAENLGVSSPRVLETWEALPETYRDANRCSAEHLPVLLAATGREPATFDPAAFAAISDEEWGRLARIEHKRWCADRIDRGWRHGVLRDDAARRHPCLVDWSELSATDREKDVNAVRTLLALAARGVI